MDAGHSRIVGWKIRRLAKHLHAGSSDRVLLVSKKVKRG